MRWLEGIIESMDMSLSKPWKREEYGGAWWAAVHGATKSQTPLSDRGAGAVCTEAGAVCYGWR